MNGKYEWMTDCSEQIEREERTSKIVVRVLTGGVVAVLAMGVLMHSCTEAVVRTAENQERYYSQPFQLNPEQQGYAQFSASTEAPHRK